MFKTSKTSRKRALLSDFGAGLAQQMILWGCDARYPGGNLLVRMGMERLAREEVSQEGSSRYRTPWKDGLVEVHSFCAGWYPTIGTGVVFIRHWKRFAACEGGMPAEPGRYAMAAAFPDEMLELVRPIAEWIVDYETRVQAAMGTAYREACFRQAVRSPGVRPWLPPQRAVEWMEGFLRDADSVGRAREWVREVRAAA